jgi:hypothetical protein
MTVVDRLYADKAALRKVLEALPVLIWKPAGSLAVRSSLANGQ